MAFGFEIVNESGEIVLDSNFSPLWQKRRGPLARIGSSRGLHYYNTTDANGPLDMLFTPLVNTTFMTIGPPMPFLGPVSTGGTSIITHHNVAQKASITATMEPSPTSESTYGMEIFDQSGNRLFTHDSRILSIQSFHEIKQGQTVTYPQRATHIAMSAPSYAIIRGSEEEDWYYVGVSINPSNRTLTAASAIGLPGEYRTLNNQPAYPPVFAITARII